MVAVVLLLRHCFCKHVRRALRFWWPFLMACVHLLAWTTLCDCGVVVDAPATATATSRPRDSMGACVRDWQVEYGRKWRRGDVVVLVNMAS